MLKKSHNFPKVSIVNLSQSCYPGQGWGSGSIQACGCFTWRLEDNPPTVLVFSSKSPGLCTNPVFNPKCSLLLQLLISYWIKSWPVGALVLSSNVFPFHQNICGLQEPAAGHQGPPPREFLPLPSWESEPGRSQSPEEGLQPEAEDSAAVHPE